MHIAVFADLHGRLLLAFKLCARWQQESGERIDLILQAGDLGAYPAMERLDRATRAYAARDPSELGFLEHFTRYDAQIADQLAMTGCPLVFVRGNHEDHAWLDELESQQQSALFPIDAYRRIYLLRTGLPWTFQQQDEQITLLGIGRIAPPAEAEDRRQARYIQQDESARLCALDAAPLDVLLTHHARPDFVLLERAGTTFRASSGMAEITSLLEKKRPACHFFGHYGGPPQVCTDPNGVTLSVKLADLHWERGGSALQAGSMGLLHWQSRDQYTFEVLDSPWLREYNTWTWRDL
ncbi:MAG TPA: metallophosphoesterase [Ktedonobacteraceae bacterium]|jgi:Icc-related predicted phosphoesterase